MSEGEACTVGSMLLHLAALPQPLIQLITHQMTEVSARTAFRTVSKAARSVSDSATSKLSISHTKSESDAKVFHKELGSQFPHVNHLSVALEYDLTPLEHLCTRSPAVLQQLKHLHIKARVVMPYHLCGYLAKLRDACSPACRFQLTIITDSEHFLFPNITFDLPNPPSLDFIAVLQSAMGEPAAALMQSGSGQHITQLSIHSIHSPMELHALDDQDDFDLNEGLTYSEGDVLGNTQQALSILHSLPGFSRLKDLQVSANLPSVASCALYHISNVCSLTHLELNFERNHDEDLYIDDEGAPLDWSMICHLGSLQSLVITSAIEGSIAIPHDWSQLTVLTKLCMDVDEIHDLDAISTLTSLQHLCLQRLEGSTPLAFLDELKQLTHFECNLSFDSDWQSHAEDTPSYAGPMLPAVSPRMFQFGDAVVAGPVVGTGAFVTAFPAPPAAELPLWGWGVHPALGTHLSDLFACSYASALYVAPTCDATLCRPGDYTPTACTRTFEPKSASTTSPSLSITPQPAAPHSTPLSASAATTRLPLTSISFSDEGVIPPYILEAFLPNLEIVTVLPPAAIRLDPKVIQWLSKPQLKTLELCLNKATSSSTISQISSLNSLETLKVNSQRCYSLDACDAALTRWLAALTSLTCLELSFSNDDARKGMPPLHSSSTLQHLKHLSLEMIHFDAQVSDWLAPLSHLTSLKIHHCSSANPSSTGLTALRGMSHLRHLQLAQVVLDPAAASSLAILTSLETLKLFNCTPQLGSQQSPACLSGLQRLSSVYIGLAQPGLPPIMHWLSTAPALRKLEVKQGRCHADPADRFTPCAFPRLRSLMIHEMSVSNVAASLSTLRAPQLEELVGTGCDVPPAVAFSLLLHSPLLQPSGIKQVSLQLSGNEHTLHVPNRIPLKPIQPLPTGLTDGGACYRTADSGHLETCGQSANPHGVSALAGIARMISHLPISANSSPACLSTALRAVGSEVATLCLRMDGHTDLQAAFCTAWVQLSPPPLVQLLDIDVCQGLLPTLQHCKQLLSLGLDSPHVSELTLQDAQWLVRSCPKLKCLRLSLMGNLTGPVLGTLAELNDLEYMRMTNCSWRHAQDLIQMIKQLPALRALVLEECEQVGSALGLFRLSRQLTEVGVFVPVYSWEEAWMLPALEPTL